jgi:hypothetical protein
MVEDETTCLELQLGMTGEEKKGGHYGEMGEGR